MKRHPTAFLKEDYEELVKNDFDWKLRILETGSTPHSIVDGKEVIMFCSNNYLNLSNHPRLIQGAIDGPKICYCVNNKNLTKAKSAIDKLFTKIGCC